MAQAPDWVAMLFILALVFLVFSMYHSIVHGKGNWAPIGFVLMVIVLFAGRYLVGWPWG